MLVNPSKEEKLFISELEGIEKRVNDLVTAGQEEINKLELQKAQNDEKIAAAEKKMRLAEDNLDAAAYVKAKQELDTCKTQREMIEKAIMKRQTEMLVSEEDINSVVSAVNAVMDKYNLIVSPRLAELSREMRDAAWGLYDASSIAQSIVRKIKMSLDLREERFKTYSVRSARATLNWATSGMANQLYDDGKKYPQIYPGTGIADKNYFIE